MLQDRVLAQNMVGIGTVYKKTRAVMQISLFLCGNVSCA